MDISEVKQRICGPLAPVLTVYREGDLALDLDAIQENRNDGGQRRAARCRGGRRLSIAHF